MLPSFTSFLELRSLRACQGRIDLVEKLLIGEVLEDNSAGRTLLEHRPSPLQSTGFTTAFLPFGVSRNSMAPYAQAVIHAPHETHSSSSTSQTEPEAVTVSCERRVTARPAAPCAWMMVSLRCLG